VVIEESFVLHVQMSQLDLSEEDLSEEQETFTLRNQS
jgi:hypothetical protein